MVGQEAGFRNFHIHAYLPFVKLAQQSLIQFGPVVFWPALKTDEFLSEHYAPLLTEYLHEVGKIKARNKDQENQYIETSDLNVNEMTCVSVTNEISSEAREFLIVDALYLLYFTSSFRNLYYGQNAHSSFNSFRKMMPASEEFVKNKENWKNLYIKEVDKEETINLNFLDPEICKGLGKALEAIYLPSDEIDSEFSQAYRRIVRAIRYLVDRSFHRFVNLFDKGLEFSEELYEPENAIFLTSSFESLFNIENSQEPAADFKHKLRPLLHLKYSRPVEIFWKWVDEFYDLKRRILRGENFLEPMFRLNPNFEVSHIQLGMKLFVYSVYYYLFKYQLLHSTYVDPYTPPDFKWIHPEEILLFFWTEGSVLEKIDLFVKEYEQGPLKDEALSDMNLLTTLFVSMYDRYYLSSHVKGEEGLVVFLPSSLSEIKKDGTHILEKVKEMSENDPESTFLKHIHPYFVNALEDRLLERKIGKEPLENPFPAL